MPVDNFKHLIFSITLNRLYLILLLFCTLNSVIPKLAAYKVDEQATSSPSFATHNMNLSLEIPNIVSHELNEQSGPLPC